MILQRFNSPEGRLRLLGWVEGITLIVLVFIAVPLKYGAGQSGLVKTMGPIHGAAFLLFLFNALGVGIRQRWSFREQGWKVLLACFIPFGTFYIDRKMLRHL
jgi:integral membrane protein